MEDKLQGNIKEPSVETGQGLGYELARISLRRNSMGTSLPSRSLERKAEGRREVEEAARSAAKHGEGSRADAWKKEGRRGRAPIRIEGPIEDLSKKRLGTQNQGKEGESVWSVARAEKGAARPCTAP